MREDTREYMELTRAEAKTLVQGKAKRERARWCIHVRMDAPIPAMPGKCFPDACSSGVRLSRAQAARFLADCLTDTMEARGARIPVGRNTYFNVTGSEDVTYWIGACRPESSTNL